MSTYSIGKQIAGYTLQNMVGKGAAGEVWLASTPNGQTVAIKLMNLNLMSSTAAEKHHERMAREIEALQSLSHPCIPALVDYKLDHEPPFLVMSYVRGEPHDKLLRTGQMMQIPLAVRILILRQIADAIACAHEKGIVHRDIKPANVLGVEHPYLIDFNLAVKVDSIRSTMQEVGTSLYMPPETNVPDALSDNYSFAVYAYEMLFGLHPIFRAEDMDVLGGMSNTLMLAASRIMRGEWRVPTRVPFSELPLDIRNANLSALDAIFTRAFGSREGRYLDPREFVADVEKALNIPAVRRGKESSKRRDLRADESVDLNAPTDVLFVPDEVRAQFDLSHYEKSVDADSVAVPFAPPPRLETDDFTILENERAAARAKTKRIVIGVTILVMIVIVVLIVLSQTSP